MTPEEVGLLDWFGALTPGERLAELESRVNFFRSARPDDDPQSFSGALLERRVR